MVFEMPWMSVTQKNNYMALLDVKNLKVRFSGKGEDRVENTLVRSGQPKEVRQAYWDAYIEGKNEGGKSQTKFVDKDNFQIFPPVQPTGDLLRRERDIYWYGEWNPGYTPPS